MVPVDLLTAAKPEETDSAPSSPTGLEALKLVINDSENKFPVELRANACSLVGTLLKTLTRDGKDGKGKETIIAALRDSVTVLAQAADTPEKLRSAAKWASDACQ